MGRATLPDWPRMLGRTMAAAYCGLTASKFEQEVSAARLPLPVKLGGEDHWCRQKLDEALDRLTGAGIPDWEKEQPGLAA